MRANKLHFLTGLLIAGIWLGAHAAPAVPESDPHVGKWSGNFAGDSSGHFELILERGSDGAITGAIAVSPDGGGDYSAKLKTATFTGDRFSAAYDPPGDGQSEIDLKGTFGPAGADGDWSIIAKAQPSAPAVAMGTWKITRS